MAVEGQTAIGPNGERAVFRGGKWVVMPSQPQMPADPSYPYEGAQAAANVQNTQANVTAQAIDNRIKEATAGATITKTNREASTAGLPEGFMWGPDGQTAMPIPGYTRQGLSPEIRSQAIQAFSDADALERAAEEIEKLYKAGPGTTKGIQGVKDYFPTDANKVFNDAGQQARGYVKRALGFTGGEGNTAAESSALYDPYLPSAGDRDAQIEAKIAKLRALAEDSRKKASATLGGVPDENGNIRPNALTQNRLGGATGLQAAEFGATTTVDPLPPEMQAEHAAFLQQWMGNPDPQAYAQFRMELDRKYGYQGDPQSYYDGAVKMGEALRAGGATIDPNIPGVERELSGPEQLSNMAVNNPLGAAAVGAADMGSLGLVSALSGDRMGALASEYPLAMTAGQIGGAITGTGAIAKVGREVAGRVAPKLLGGGRGGMFGRNLATDVAYSGGYGGVSGDGAGEGAMMGALGSIGGQAVGSGIGRAIGGLDVAPGVEALRSRGIPMTVPQQLGGFAKAVEDRATSLPLVGDMIAKRRMEGLEAFNREAMSEAGKPIGFSPSTIGREGVDQMVDAVGNYYDNATAGVNVPLDGQFIADMGAFGQAAQALPRDLRVRAAQAIENRVTPISDAGQMTGEQYQQAIRGLKGYKAEVSKPGFEQDYRDALSLAQDALTGQMVRGGGEQVVSGLRNADSAYRGIKTVEDAAFRADGADYLFTPSQLQDALKKTQRKFPGQTPLSQLADEGQQVLPSRVPDSGTAGRAAQMIAPGALIGGGAAAGGALGGAEGAQDGAAYSAALTTLALLGGTKAGQKALTGAIIARPDKLKELARGVRKRKGMFGSAALPFFVSDY